MGEGSGVKEKLPELSLIDCTYVLVKMLSGDSRRTFSLSELISGTIQTPAAIHTCHGWTLLRRALAGRLSHFRRLSFLHRLEAVALALAKMILASQRYLRRDLPIRCFLYTVT